MPAPAPFSPLKFTPCYQRAAKRFAFVVQFDPTAKSWNAEKRQNRLTATAAANLLAEYGPTKGLEAAHVWRFLNNPVGISGADKAPPSVVLAAEQLVEMTFPLQTSEEAKRIGDAMDALARLPGLTDSERLDVLRGGFRWFVDGLRDETAPVSTMQSMRRWAVIAYYDQWEAHLEFRIGKKPAIFKAAEKAVTSLKNLGLITGELHSNTRNPIRDLEDFQRLSNTYQIMMMNPSNKKNMRIDVENESYFEQARRFNSLVPWSEGEVRHALTVASYLEDESVMTEFGGRLLETYERIISVKHSHFPRSHEVYQLDGSIFVGSLPLAKTAVMAAYMAKIHPSVLSQFRAVQPLRQVAA